MRKLKKLVGILLCLALLVTLSFPAFAQGYIVCTTVEEVTTVNGVVTGYSVNTYDSAPVYGTVPPATTNAVATAVTQGAKTTTASTTATSQWVPNWGPNYAAEQAKYMNSSQKSSSSSCWKPNYGNSYSYSQSQPVVYVTNSAGRTIGDEARAQAEDIKNYALDKNWTVSVSGDWGDCDYRNIEIKVSNRDHSRTYKQVTVAQNGGYATWYEYDGYRFTKDDFKYYLKDRRV